MGRLSPIHSAFRRVALAPLGRTAPNYELSVGGLDSAPGLAASVRALQETPQSISDVCYPRPGDSKEDLKRKLALCRERFPHYPWGILTRVRDKGAPKLKRKPEPEPPPPDPTPPPSNGDGGTEGGGGTGGGTEAGGGTTTTTQAMRRRKRVEHGGGSAAQAYFQERAAGGNSAYGCEFPDGPGARMTGRDRGHMNPPDRVRALAADLAAVFQAVGEEWTYTANCHSIRGEHVTVEQGSGPGTKVLTPANQAPGKGIRRVPEESRQKKERKAKRKMRGTIGQTDPMATQRFAGKPTPSLNKRSPPQPRSATKDLPKTPP